MENEKEVETFRPNKQGVMVRDALGGYVRLEDYEAHGKAMFEKGQATGIRMLWELCSDFKLGAGGCPDGLIREYVTRLKERVQELEAQLVSALNAEGRLRDELESRKVPLCPICGKEVAIICPDDLEKLRKVPSGEKK